MTTEESNTDMSSTYVVLWSPSLQTLHAEVLEDLIAANRAAYIRSEYIENSMPGDFVPLFIGGKVECLAALHNCRETLRKRQDPSG